ESVGFLQTEQETTSSHRSSIHPSIDREEGMNGRELPSRSRRHATEEEEFERHDIVVDGRSYVVSRRRRRRFPDDDDDTYNNNNNNSRDSPVLLRQHYTIQDPPSKRARVLITDDAIHRGLRAVTPGSAQLLQTACAVCLGDFDADDDKLISAMPCAHAFHEQCIFPWLRSNAVCPLCRRPLLPPPPTTQEEDQDQDQTAFNVPAPEDP
ncbi:hypothetical protein EJB05_02078, partial [Eragrostis curvula]